MIGGGASPSSIAGLHRPLADVGQASKKAGAFAPAFSKSQQ